MAQKGDGREVSWPVVNEVLSHYVKEAIDARPKNCWGNALFALQILPELDGGFYVEGWAVMLDYGIPFEHGWIELEGEIVDPTLYDAPLAYFLGLRFSLGEAQWGVLRETSTMEAGELPIVWRYGWGGREHPEYQRAMKQAHAFAKEVRDGT